MNTNTPAVVAALEVTRLDGSTVRFENVIVNGPDSNRLAVSFERGFLVFETSGSDTVTYVPNVDWFTFEHYNTWSEGDPWFTDEPPF